MAFMASANAGSIPVRAATAKISQLGFFARFFLVCARFHFSSAFSRSSLEILSTVRRALLIFSLGESPGTFGAGSGFTIASLQNSMCPSACRWHYQTHTRMKLRPSYEAPARIAVLGAPYNS